MTRALAPHAAAAGEPRVGVLALQGDFEAHARVLSRLGAAVTEVRRPQQLAGLCGLILPGGESTTLLKLMDKTGFEPALREFHGAGKALFGTCAGMILLARNVTGPRQPSLGLIDIDVERNAYGRQIDSFEQEADWIARELLCGVEGGGPDRDGGNGSSRALNLPLVFIRAPRVTRLGEGVVPLARCRGDVVLARQGRVMVAAFHPEISGDDRVHRVFLRLCAATGLRPSPPRGALASREVTTPS